MKLVGGEFHVMPCPECAGTGKRVHTDWQRRDGKWVAGGGVMPCAACHGAKIVTVPVVKTEKENA